MSVRDQIDAFVVTARKWRPQLFSEVVGQEHISTTLSNALQTGRVHHAYLFCGPRGVGKTTTARIFARALNCQNSKNGIEPCNECESCQDILSGRSLDVIEIDGASNNSVDDVRKLRENAKYPPVHGKYKMYIIDEVHMLSTSAFNALLKTLEEPPPHLLFMFATTESHKVPATIVSRCQRFDFRRMQIDDIVRHLAYIATEEKMQIDEQSLVAIAKKGDGSMRDAQSIFDQVRAFCGDVIEYKSVAGALHLIDEDFYFSISDAIREHNAAHMFELVQQVISRGYDIHECLMGLTEHFRDILSIIATGETKLIEASAATLQRLRETAQHFRQPDVLRIMTMINTADQQLKFSAQPRFRVELLLVQLASLDSTVEIAELLNEIRDSKKNGSKIGMLNAVVHATMPSPPSAARVSSAARSESTPPQTTAQPRSSASNGSAPYRGGTSSASTASTATSTPTSTIGSQAKGATAKPEYSKNSSEGSVYDGGASSTTVAAFTEGPLVSSHVLQAGWSEFMKTLPSSLASVKVALNSREFSSIRYFDSEILIMSSEKFMCDEILSRRAQLGTQLERFFGTDIRMKIVHSRNIHELPEQSSDDAVNGINNANDNSGSGIEAAIAAASSTTADQAVNERLAIEHTLVDLFAAKKIPLSSV